MRRIAAMLLLITGLTATVARAESPEFVGSTEAPFTSVTISTVKPSADDAIAAADHFVVSQNYPNPFNLETTVSYNLPEDATTLIKVYDILGKEVRELENHTEAAGYHRVVWNGLDDDGNEVASGVYMFVLAANDFYATRKMVLVK